MRRTRLVKHLGSMGFVVLASLAACNLHSGSGLDPDEILDGGPGDGAGPSGDDGSGGGPDGESFDGGSSRDGTILPPMDAGSDATVIDAGCPTCEGTCVDLTSDPNNCGRCAHGCGGGTCAAGVCQPVAMTPTENIPWSIEVASGTVYWIEQDSTHHALHAEPTGGGGVMNLYSTSSSDPTAPEDNLAVDATGIYYGSFNDIIRIGPGGGSTFVLSQNNPWPQGMAIDASNVYWATQGQCPFPYDGGTCQTGFVYQVSQGGGTVFTLSSGERAPASVAVMGGMVYWMSDGAGDGTASAVVRSAPIGGGPVRTIASGFVADYNHDGNNPCSTCLAVDATSVYFTTYDGTSTSAVMKVPLTGGVATTLASSFGDVNSLALDSSGLYIADQQQGSIVQVPVGGGAPVVVVAAGTNAPMTPWNIALDANDVYYTAFQCPGGGGECSGQVFRVAKP